MRNNNSKLAFDQARGWTTVLGAAKTNITPAPHNSHYYWGWWFDIDWVSWGPAAHPPYCSTGRYGAFLSSLESRGPARAALSAVMAFCGSLRPECRMGLVIQATHCPPPEKAIISPGPADWVKTYPSLYFYASVFLLSSYFSHCLAFFFLVLGQQMCSDVGMGLFVHNASVTRRGARAVEFTQPSELLSHLNLWEDEVSHKYAAVK